MKEFLDWSIDRLNQAGIHFPQMEAEVLLAGALKLSREEIYRRPELPLTETEKTILYNFIDRRVKREPIAYILKSKEFWSLDFKITPDERDLNYDQYFSKGTVKPSIDEYNSNNTKLLSIDEMKNLLMALPQIKEEINN